MKKYYLGLDYYDKQTGQISGSMSWEAEKMDFSYDSLEEIEEEIFTQYREEYKAIRALEEDELEDYELPIYSVEEKTGEEFKTISYYLPPQKIVDLLGIEWRGIKNPPPYMEKLRELYEQTKAEMIILTDETL